MTENQAENQDFAEEVWKKLHGLFPDTSSIAHRIVESLELDTYVKVNQWPGLDEGVIRMMNMIMASSGLKVLITGYPENDPFMDRDLFLKRVS